MVWRGSVKIEEILPEKEKNGILLIENQIIKEQNRNLKSEEKFNLFSRFDKPNYEVLYFW